MIQAIKPVAREAYDQAYKWEKDEESRFAQRLQKAARYPEMPEQPLASNANFDNPAFNIIAGPTNYALRSLASDRRMNASQMELFERRTAIAKA